MKQLFLVLSLAALLVVGCSSGSGDTKTAEEATKRMPKSADELPADMSPEAKAQAAAAIAANQAMAQQMDSQAQAMKKAREQMANK